MLLVLAVFVLSGPFGTFAEMSLLQRTIYWTPQAVLGLIVAGTSCEVAYHLFPTAKRSMHGLMSALLFALMFAPLDYLITRSQVLGAPDFIMPFWQVLMTNFAFAMILAIWVMVNETPYAVGEVQEKPRLYARLPRDAKGKIMHITVSDHYKVVTMEDGSQHRMLLRFSDAVMEMDETIGCCTHRSHWVATEFVKEGKRLGNKEFVGLASGADVPVSKTYRENLVSAGYFEQA